MTSFYQFGSSKFAALSIRFRSLYRICLPVLIVLVSWSHAPAQQEYFLSPLGNDTADGKSPATAFASFQKGLDILSPGDTLTFLPGQYFAFASRDNLGSMEKETTLRAAIPGTVLIHGNVPVSGFQKVDGYRFVYVTDFEQRPYSIGEVDTLTLMNEAIYLDEVEFLPGTYFYDEQAKKLYLSASDLQSPEAHVYRVCVVPEHGLYLLNPKRVVIEGLGFSGFHFNEALNLNVGATKWGVYLQNAERCVIRNCVAYLNGGGLLIMNPDSGGENIIEDSVAYANNSRHNNEGGNIAIIRGRKDEILRRNYVYRSPGHGQRFYGEGDPDSSKLMEHSLGWGNGSGDLWIKGVDLPFIASNNAALGVIPRHSIFSLGGFSANNLDSRIGSDNIFLADLPGVDPNQEFADPDHFDFRLQSTSRFRGAASDGRDLGPFPYEANILYVAPRGDDTNDGLSFSQPLRTLAAALERSKAGFTIYLAGGTYPESVTVTQSDLTIRRRGKEPVLLSGDWKLQGAQGILLERLQFLGGFDAVSCGRLQINHCAFSGNQPVQISGTGDLRIRHCLFAGSPDFRDSKELFLAGNIFASSPGFKIQDQEGILYSDYNSFPSATSPWEVAGKAMALESIRPEQENQSLIAAPAFLPGQAALELAESTPFAGRGPMGKSIGLYFEGDLPPVRTEGPFLHSTTDTTANLEWWTSLPSVVELSWGETPELGQTRILHQHCFATFSLTGLKPGTTYYYQWRYLRPHPSLAGVELVPSPDELVVAGTFTTNREPHQPRVYFVSPEGSDTADGLSPSTAWKTVNHAADRVRAGDTVHLAGGVYRETVWLRATGDENRPIRFLGATGKERTIFDGHSRRIGTAFYAHGKKHLHFDAIQARDLGHISPRGSNNLAFETGGMFTFAFSSDLQVDRSMLDGRGIMYSPSLFTLDSTNRIVFRNCVQIAAMDRSRAINSSAVKVENSVFFRSLISSLLLDNLPEQVVSLRNSIVTDSLPKKFGNSMIVTTRISSLQIENNCFYPRDPQEEKSIVFVYNDEAFERSMRAFLIEPGQSDHPALEDHLSIPFQQLDRYFGDSGSIMANPQFLFLAGEDADDKYITELLGNREVDFNAFFSTNPELNRRNIGLEPKAFADFEF
jgi:hypothetical protein